MSISAWRKSSWSGGNSGNRVEKAVVEALRSYAERLERSARLSRHFERARGWGAVEDAERLQQAEKRRW